MFDKNVRGVNFYANFLILLRKKMVTTLDKKIKRGINFKHFYNSNITLFS